MHTRPYIHDNFLLANPLGEKFYHEVAAKLPVIDFHNHLSPKELFQARRFENLTELWLAHDNYKWRAMRLAGIPEPLITGNACAKDKFMAWAATVPQLLGSPLFEWTHLELARFFGINEILTPATAERIWNCTESQMASMPFTTETVLESCNVRAACSTDDPADSLEWHSSWGEQHRHCQLLPTFRPDQALAVHSVGLWKSWLTQLAATAESAAICTFPDLLQALDKRHADFHDLGCRISDHGLSQLPTEKADYTLASQAFERALKSQPLANHEAEIFRATLLHELARFDANRGWTKQIHLGALRNNCSGLLRDLGPDAGADSIGDWPQINQLRQFLDALAQLDQMPDLIVYALNPADLYSIATMLGNFARAGKRVRLGAAWWFLDHRDGIRMTLDVVAATGLLAQFPGMVTDSRSILSLCRHDWFRRIFCDWLGEKVQSGSIPSDDSLLTELIQRVCFGNANQIVVPGN